MTAGSLQINRAPVLTLWAAVVARRLGFDWDEALTLGQAVAGMSAYAKGVSIGVIEPRPRSLGEERKKQAGKRVYVALMGRTVPVFVTPEGLRADNKGKPAAPAAVRRYLEGKFGDALPDTIAAMRRLAGSLPPGELATRAFKLYEAFRPTVPSGAGGWGAKGTLKLDAIAAAAKPAGKR